MRKTLPCIESAASRFRNAGIDTAKLDAEVLMAHTIGVDRVDLYINRHREITEGDFERFDSFVKRRVNREPVAYITGCKEFWSEKITVTPDVLIPRPETEGIVETAVRKLKGKLDILDLCTGSGCVAAALAKRLPDAKITVTDISPAAIEVARQNLLFAGVRITFLTGNLFNALNQKPITDHCSLITKKFDLITANPPYINDGDFEKLAPEISKYEPPIALKGGPDGLAISKRIIQDAPGYLKNGGTLIIEMGIGQADALKNIAEQTQKYQEIEVMKDYAGIERILNAKLKL